MLFTLIKESQQLESQLDLLEQIYNENGGDDWTGASLWLNTSVSYCSWEGVTCNRDEYVIQLDLSGFGLKNEMSSAFGQLEYLKSLYINNASFTGSIQEDICNLQFLQYLQLDNAGFSGNIPTCICDLQYLKFFYADNNTLNGSIPDCVGNMTSLIELHLTCNDITGTIPTGFDSLQYLTELRVECNDGLDCTSELSSKTDFIFLCGTDFDYCDECIPSASCPDCITVPDCGQYCLRT